MDHPDRSERESLISVFGYVVNHLEDNGYRFVGVLRRVLRELVAESVSCPQCGGPIEHRELGRPATYCSTACRQKAWRAATK